TTVRSDSVGNVVTTDGPFLETKEALGGYYTLEAQDLDEVIKLASQLPEVQNLPGGTVSELLDGRPAVCVALKHRAHTVEVGPERDQRILGVAVGAEVEVPLIALLLLGHRRSCCR